MVYERFTMFVNCACLLTCLRARYAAPINPWSDVRAFGKHANTLNLRIALSEIDSDFRGDAAAEEIDHGGALSGRVRRRPCLPPRAAENRH
ncbi:hypothetical protein MES5069_130021 [Mesorhizobium escarrei]|uniref:Uncharacterized protein n=1 Tax=Mesorhizobium escarrei TaxID=666018 RepID=A0ABM9DHH3_9HYPH|nr:hypothetical protein MES5069_130021 [Mesorhizobium escarrei]